MRRFWPLILLAALGCGKVRTVSPSDPDAAVDVSDAAPAGPGIVTVRVEEMFDPTSFGEPLPDLPVLFFGPDHELIAEEETDDDGMASATVPPGSVVLVLGEYQVDEAATFAAFDVQPGDEIVFRSREAPAEPGLELQAMTIDFPDSLDADLSYYRADNGCSTSTSQPESSQINLTFDTSCLEVGTSEFDVVVRALDGEDNVLETAHGRFVYSDMGTATLDAWNGTRDLELPLTGIPDELRIVSARATPVMGRLAYGTILTDPIEPPDDAHDVSVGAIDGWDGALAVFVDYRPVQTALGRQIALYHVDADTAELPLALDTDLLPWYGRPAFSGAARTLSWPRIGPGSPDAQYIEVVGETKSGTTNRVFAVVPPDWTSVTFPALPDDHGDHAVDAYGQLQSAVQGIDSSDHDGYEVRMVGILPLLWSSYGFPADPDVGFHLKISGLVGK